MATFLDVTGLKHFSSIFVFLFVWLVVFATLSWSKILGENKFVITLVGLLLGVFTLLSPIATDVIASTAPFLAVIFVFIILVNVASKMLGGADVEAFPALKGVFLILIIIIIVVAVGVKIREQVDVPSETQQDLSKTINLIFHPTFLGTVLILAIAVFTIALLASRSA